MRSSHLTTEFKEKISAYEDGNNVQMVYNDSQTLEAANKGAKKSKQGKEGVSLSCSYSLHLHLTVMCLFGGKMFHMQSVKDRARGLITGIFSIYIMA